MVEMEKIPQLAICLLAFSAAASGYHVGIGVADMSGPAFGVGMFGYAQTDQILEGVHTRMFARAFIVADEDKDQALDDSDPRIVYLVMDGLGASQLMKKRLLSRLSSDYGSLYTDDNLMVAMTHTHSGPAGASQYMMYNLMNVGFVQQTFDAFVEGTYQAIKRAHNNLQPARIYYQEGELTGVGNNRSPSSYLLNADVGNYTGDTDKIMKQLQFFSHPGNAALGVLNWFPLHTTSIDMSNLLMSGDSYGYASQFLEITKNQGHANHQAVRGKRSQQATTTPFVAAFAQANSGDVSPNNWPPKCTSDGSTCDGSVACPSGGLCVATGPGSNGIESAKIVGQQVADKSLALLNDLTGRTELTGGLDYRLQYMDMAYRTVTAEDGSQQTTCGGSLGKSMFAGTTDGPGLDIFLQGMTKDTINPPFLINYLFDSNPLHLEFWLDIVLAAINIPSPWEDACQGKKDLAIAPGEMYIPHKWIPNILDTQLFKLDNVLIAGVPTEITTMAGRRVVNAVQKPYIEAGQTNMKVALSTLTGVYAGYTSTKEEYDAQRYEAASTLFGPYQLDAFLNQYEMLSNATVTGATVPKLTPPPDLDWLQIKGFNTYIPKKEFVPLFKSMGQCKKSLSGKSYNQGDIVSARFISGDPRNNLKQSWNNQWTSFLWVERKLGWNNWEVVATDADWETTIKWKVVSVATNEYQAKIKWTIPSGQPGGTYRIVHTGWSFQPTVFQPFRYISHEANCGEFQVA